MRLRSFLAALCILLLIGIVSIPVQAQTPNNCSELFRSAATLLTQAKTAFDRGDLASGKALIVAAQAVIKPCATAAACPNAAQVGTILTQIEEQTVAATASALVGGAQALLATCPGGRAGPIITPSRTRTPTPLPRPTIEPTTNFTGTLLFTRRTITTTGTSNTGYELFIQTGGEAARRIIASTSPVISVGNASLSPDGKSVVYSDFRTGNGEIYVAGSDGTNPVNVSNRATSADIAPAWSPDSKQIAFLSNRDSAQVTEYALFIMDADGTNAKRITAPANNIGLFPPIWAEGGKQILMRTTLNTLTFYDLEGSEQRRVRTTLAITWVALSPDGKQLALAARASSSLFGASRLYTLDVEDEARPKMIEGDFADVFYVQWSPDGKQMMFTQSLRPGGFTARVIYILDMETKALQSLTTSQQDVSSIHWSDVKVSAP